MYMENMFKWGGQTTALFVCLEGDEEEVGHLPLEPVGVVVEEDPGCRSPWESVLAVPSFDLPLGRDDPNELVEVGAGACGAEDEVQEVVPRRRRGG